MSESLTSSNPNKRVGL